MAQTEEYDIVVVGGGTSGTFAAGKAASEGLEVAVLERKSEEEGGHVACGDAVHNPFNEEEFPGPFDMEEVAERSGVDFNIEKGEYWDEELGVKKVVDFADNPGNVVDRYEWGQALLDQAAEQGAEIYYDTVANDAIQDGKVEGVEAVSNGNPVRFEADLVIDAGGALSVMQDFVDFDELDVEGGTHFENPNYQQFGSAYREIVETEQPVDYDDAIVVKPVPGADTGMAYYWYFPRTSTEINVGLGFQMSEEPLEMPGIIQEDLENRPEYDGAWLKKTLGTEDKLGSALGLRRPLDSAVAPGYIAVGDAAGMVSPTTGKGITGAAISGHSAGRIATEAVSEGDVSEERLWEHNHYIFSEHGEGAKLAAQDVLNVAGSAYELDELRGAVALLPVEPMMDGISGKGGSYDGVDVAKIGAGFAWNNIRHFLRAKAPLVDGFDQLDTSQKRANEVIAELYPVKQLADETREHYQSFPEERDGFDEWQTIRDYIDDRVLEKSGADPKY